MANRLFMGFRNGDVRIRVSAPGHDADNWSLSDDNLFFDSDWPLALVYHRGVAAIAAGVYTDHLFATFPTIGFRPVASLIAFYGGDPVGRRRTIWYDRIDPARGAAINDGELRYSGQHFEALNIEYMIYNIPAATP
jgi:hypothetical protein